MNNDTALTTLLGGKEITVLLENGESEQIKVRQLPIRKLEEFLQKIGDEDAMVELYASKESGWSQRLSRDSWEQVLDLGEAMNLDFFTRRAKARIERQEKIMPGFKDRLEQTQSKMIEEIASRLSSSVPA